MSESGPDQIDLSSTMIDPNSPRARLAADIDNFVGTYGLDLAAFLAAQGQRYRAPSYKPFPMR